MIILSLTLDQARTLTNVMDVAVRANGIRVVQEIAGLFALITEATVEAHKRGDLNENNAPTAPDGHTTGSTEDEQAELPLAERVD